MQPLDRIAASIPRRTLSSLTWYRREIDDSRDHGAQADKDPESKEHDDARGSGSSRCEEMIGAEMRENVEKQACGLAGVVVADTLAPLGQVHCQGESRLPIKRKIFRGSALCAPSLAVLHEGCLWSHHDVNDDPHLFVTRGSCILCESYALLSAFFAVLIVVS